MLSRCYAQLTGQRLTVGNPLWSQVSNTQPGSGVSTCLSLFDSVQLGSNGILTQSTNPVHRRILKQFHDFHRAWFPIQWSFSNSFPDTYNATVDVYDAAEPSMFITQSLFSQQAIPYQNALRGFNSLAAVRDNTIVAPDAKGNSGFLRPSRAYYGDPGPGQDIPSGILNSSAVTVQDASNNISALSTPLVQVGQLIGIQTAANSGSPSLLWTKNFSTQASVNSPGLVTNQSMHKSYGGGALGSIPYISLNFGQDFSYAADGALNLPRRLVMTTMNTFLCLQGPFSRTTDVQQFLTAASDANAAPFRKNTACLRCHATMDQSALTMRNLALGSTLNNVGLSRAPAMVVSFNPDQGDAPQFWSPDPTPNFNRTNPVGRLFFRSVNGSLVDQKLSSLNDLGTQLSATDDYYACAASRYFSYFTGVQVNLMDPYDPLNQSAMSSMTSVDKEYLSYVLALGQQLKANGSLRTLVHTIMKSDYYKLSGFGR